MISAFRSTLSLSRNIAPIAGRTRSSNVLVKKVSKTPPPMPTSTSTKSLISKEVTSNNGTNTPLKESTFFERNERGLTNGAWSFIMFIMGIQVLRGKYERKDAILELEEAEKAMDELKKSLNPESSVWWNEIIQKAKLSSKQQEVLSKSLGSMLQFGSVLTVGSELLKDVEGNDGKNEDVKAKKKYVPTGTPRMV